MVSVSNAAVCSYPVSESVAPWKPWTANSGGTPLPSHTCAASMPGVSTSSTRKPSGSEKESTGCPKRSGCFSEATPFADRRSHPERQRIAGHCK